MWIDRSIIVPFCAVLLACPRTGSAQWYVAGYLGVNHTASSTVSIDRPALDTSLEIRDVAFDARPFESPQYYGLRAGRLLGEHRRWGVEFELVHPKLFADTSRTVPIQGRIHGASIDTTIVMDTVVQHYAMSHGMNFVLVNLVTRWPIAPEGEGFASRLTLAARGGAGPMVPHAETTIEGDSIEQYELAGLGFQLAGGIDVRLHGQLAATLDYKFGHARPEITIVEGTGRTTANVHQLAFGLAYGLSRR